MKNNERNLKEQIEIKEKEIIRLELQLKEMKSLNSKNNVMYNSNNITNNYRRINKSNLTKTNSSTNMNIYKDYLTENKDNNNNDFTRMNAFYKKNENNLNNIKQIKRLKRINNQNFNLSNSTISCQNFRKISNSKSKNKKKYNNSINYISKKYIKDLTNIFLLKEPKNKKKTKNSNEKNNTNCNNNKSMFDLFPSGNLSYLVNNQKSINNNNNNKNNNSNNKKNSNSKTKSLNITNNTINMNKNNVMINLNANIINTNTPIEKYKVQQKLVEYKRFINKKLNEISKGKKKIKNLPTNIISNKNPIKLKNNKKDNFSTCIVHYKRINKYFNKNNKNNNQNERKITPYQSIKNIKLNYYSNSSNKITTIKTNNNSSEKNKIDTLIKETKGNYNCSTNINKNTMKNNLNTNNNLMSRSSSTNSKSSINITKNKQRKKFTQKPTLKNFIFAKNNEFD